MPVGESVSLTTRLTQFICPGGMEGWVPACLAGVKAWCVHLCRVAGSTVWSHMTSDSVAVRWNSINSYTLVTFTFTNDWPKDEKLIF